MSKSLSALIEGGLSRTTGYKPHPATNHRAWLEWRLQIAKIPVKSLTAMGYGKPNTYILHAGCCIATLREQAHNSGLKFRVIKPLIGNMATCVVEFVANTEEE